MENAKENETMSKSDFDKLMNTEFKVYCYNTIDEEPGTIIINNNISNIFNKNTLFEMDKQCFRTFKLGDLLKQGMITVGSTDIMETLTIQYPDPSYVEMGLSNDKPKIKGKYLHGSRNQLISIPTKTDFILEPLSPISSNDTKISSKRLFNDVFVYDDFEYEGIYEEFKESKNNNLLGNLNNTLNSSLNNSFNGDKTNSEPNINSLENILVKKKTDNKTDNNGKHDDVIDLNEQLKLISHR